MPGPAQVTALEQLNRGAIGGEPSADSAADEWREGLVRKLEAARRAAAAEDALSQLDPFNAESIKRAVGAVESLGDADDAIRVAYQSRLRDRRQLLEDAKVRLGAAAQALVPAAAVADDSEAALPDDDREQAWCLKLALERLRQQDPRLNTPTLAGAIQALGRIPRPRPAKDVDESSAAYKDAVSGFRQVFAIVNSALDDANVDAPKDADRRYDVLIEGLNKAASRCARMPFNDDFQSDRSFKRVAEVLRQLRAAPQTQRKTPTTTARESDPREVVPKALTALQGVQKQLRKENRDRTDVGMSVDQIVEMLTELQKSLERNPGS